MFFLVFHLFLNIIGELLLFGDRVFYKVLISTYESVFSNLQVCITMLTTRYHCRR